MNNKLILTILLLAAPLISKELHIQSVSFHADQNTGVSIFQGDVKIKKEMDELNASKVTVYTDKHNKPIKLVASGDVSFYIQTEQKNRYKGKAQKVIYLPQKKEYKFFTNVHLSQINEKKEILGDEVILNTIEGKAYAKGVKSEPVIMIFKLEDTNTTKE